jgi:uncharacterized membrane protein YfcA
VAFLFYVLVSACGGLLVGVLGTGSSLLLLPSLAFIFAATFPDPGTLRVAAGTTMATMAVGAFAGAFTQYRLGHVDFRLLRLMSLPYVIGGFAGPWISLMLTSRVLGVYIGVVLAVVAVRMLCVPRESGRSPREYRQHPFVISCVLLAVGLCSSVAGVASGLFAIPYLTRFALPMRTVVGTSTAAAAIYSTCGAAGYVGAGWSASGLPAGTAGYVYLPAFAILAITAAVFTPLGVQLARHLNERALRKLFAVFLLVAAMVVAWMQ